ncbi:MAG TPA: hypothetical protein VLT51_08160 [Anaerolineales bacterium]|nr:hypothetical protein [Anaerolineales bacterium]
MKNNRISSLLVFPAFGVGVIVGLYLIVIAAWADMESAFYGFSRLADAGLDGFSCPVMMTREEMGTVSLTVSNKTDSPIRPAVKAEISTSLLTEESLDNIKLAPGESKKLTWPVGPENIDLERFIFAKALVFSAFPLPNREATCGIYIINLPGSGRVILFVLVALSLLGMGWGLYRINKTGALNEWVEKHVRPMAFLAAVVVLGIVVSFRGGWVPSILLLAVALLLIIILLGSFFMSERRKR